MRHATPRQESLQLSRPQKMKARSRPGDHIGDIKEGLPWVLGNIANLTWETGEQQQQKTFRNGGT